MHTTVLPYMGPTKTGTEPYPTEEFKAEQARARRKAESTAIDPMMCLLIKQEARSMVMRDEPRQLRRSKV